GVGHQDREVCVRVTVDVAFDDPAARHGDGPEFAGAAETDVYADRCTERGVSARRVRVDGGQVDLVHSILEIEDRVARGIGDATVGDGGEPEGIESAGGAADTP